MRSGSVHPTYVMQQPKKDKRKKKRAAADRPALDPFLEI